MAQPVLDQANAPESRAEHVFNLDPLTSVRAIMSLIDSIRSTHIGWLRSGWEARTQADAEC
jgi:hypothetical protein